jgi:hypothetical protein
VRKIKQAEQECEALRQQVQSAQAQTKSAEAALQALEQKTADRVLGLENEQRKALEGAQAGLAQAQASQRQAEEARSEAVAQRRDAEQAAEEAAADLASLERKDRSDARQTKLQSELAAEELVRAVNETTIETD